MKYCKKCFRNVREDVNVCPYCGQPGLEEYGSHKSGEDFSCSATPKPTPAKTAFAPKKEDAYTIKEDDFDVHNEEKIDAYGNVINEDKSCDNVERDAYGSLAHNDENCHNAPNAPKLSPMDSEREEKARQFFNQVSSAMDKNREDYYNMLKNIDGISQERIDYLMKKYDEEHSDTEITYTVERKEVNTRGTGIIDFVVAVILGIFNPLIGLVILLSIRHNYKKAGKEIPKIIKIAIICFIVYLVLYILFNVIN